jgi:hypothetical protein
MKAPGGEPSGVSLLRSPSPFRHSREELFNSRRLVKRESIWNLHNSTMDDRHPPLKSASRFRGNDVGRPFEFPVCTNDALLMHATLRANGSCNVPSHPLLSAERA